MSTQLRPAPDPADFEAGLERLARGSRIAGLVSVVGLLSVIGALVYSSWKLADMNEDVNRLTAEQAGLAQRIDASRQELRVVEDSLSRLRIAYGTYQAQVRRQAPTLAASAAVVARDSARAARVAYIQFRGTVSRSLMNALRAQLNQSGYSAPGVERIDRVFGNSVRYFHREDAAAAATLARDVAAFFGERGCQVTLPVQDMSTRGARVPIGQLEVWLDVTCRE